MKKLFLVGNGPLPNEQAPMRTAAGLRTYQFLKPLLAQSDVSIQLVTIAMPESYNEAINFKNIKHSEEFSQLLVSKDDPKLLEHLQQAHDEFQPDAILSVNTYPSFITSQLRFSAPWWADLNGWIMAEAQAQAFKMESDDYLPHYYKMEEAVVQRADKFSTVSSPQAYALLGELAFCGRLNSKTFGYQFVSSIQNGTEWFEGESKKGKKLVFDHAGNPYTEWSQPFFLPFLDIFRTGSKDAFVLLWVGGYNTWVDEKTLFRAVDDAMSECPNLYFVSTGGALPGLDNVTFDRFQKMVAQSVHKDRYIFLGWVKQEELTALYGLADAGLNVDRQCIETITGARNRINEMMKFGLPVISTLGSEVVDFMSQAEAGVAVENGNFQALTKAIHLFYQDKKDNQGQQLAEYGKNGRHFIQQECNYKLLIQPFVEWLTQPVSAPDRGLRLSLQKSSAVKSGLRYLRQQGFKKFLLKLRQKFHYNGRR